MTVMHVFIMLLALKAWFIRIVSFQASNAICLFQIV